MPSFSGGNVYRMPIKMESEKLVVEEKLFINVPYKTHLNLITSRAGFFLPLRIPNSAEKNN